MQNCENCGCQHIGNFGSGRFCSMKCSRSFSTKDKRDIINEKVSKKLRKERKVLTCESCKNKFQHRYLKKTCSKKCQDDLQRGRSKKGNYSANGGIRNGGGKSKVFSYISWLGEEMFLNKDEIKLASIFDKHRFIWNRNWKGFSYIDTNGKKRNFFPDFYVKDIDSYVEYKGWLTSEIRHKMIDAKKRNELSLIIVVGEDKRYLNDGYTLEQFIEKYTQVW